MKRKKKSILKNVLTIGLVGTISMLLSVNSVNATGNMEAEFKSVIDQYDLEEVIVEDGIIMTEGDTLDLTQYPEWQLSNNNAATIENGILTAKNNGTVFLSQRIGEKVYIVEVYVEGKSQQKSTATYSTTVNRSYYKVFVDAGHGGSDPGAVGNGYRESDLNLQIAKRVETKLKAKGIEVKMSRTTDVYNTVSEKASMSNAYGPDVFVSIHQNSYSSSSANGIETLYRTGVTKYKEYAQNIQTKVISATGATDRGVKERDNLTVLNKTTSPSALVECGFISNTTEVKNLANSTYQDKLAGAIADGIEVFLKNNVVLSSEVNVSKSGVVNTDSLNVRSGYSTDYDVIGTLTKGTKVEIVAEQNNWYKIKFNGGYGHVSATYITLDPSSKYPDIKGHWAQAQIEDFILKGYINGYEDSTFRPQNSITRAEFVKLVNKVFNYTQAGSVSFSDVPTSHWAYNEIAIAIKEGYIDGYGNNTFKPNDYITREEAAKIVSTILNIQGDGNLSYNDTDEISDWAKEHVDALSDKGILVGGSNNNFYPKDNMTRAEVVVMLSRVN